ncbi:MAG: galactokinase [Armatimonadota bacterium]|nr:galactokinase [Armatimonadota bacterium]
MIITRTPMRIPLGGGGTDIVSYSSRFGGFILSAAIDKYSFITVHPRPIDSHIRASYSKTEIVRTADEIQHNLIREALKMTGITNGIEILSLADVPAGSGLGTSGCFTVGLLNALHTLKGEQLTQIELAEEACRIEIDILREPIGKHDQYIAALGGLTCLEIDHSGHVRVHPAAIHEDVLEELERNILLFYTGIARSASEVLAEQSTATDENDRGVIDSLHRIKEIGFEVKGALESGNLHQFGLLLHTHWEVKKQLSNKISSSQIDKWYHLARESGALGGKIMGAGGGGFFMLYCEEGKDRLRKAMAYEGLLEMRFRFDFQGAKVMLNV